MLHCRKDWILHEALYENVFFEEFDKLERQHFGINFAKHVIREQKEEPD